MSRLLFWLLMKTAKGGGMNMVIVMVSLIIWGDITFEQVPAKQQGAVKAKLEAQGLNENGQPIEAV
ncbi:hypothetical protein UB51_14670 [Paenibacillus sp. IHBB 10380]|nr:hypothetical protein UB51_14670 [Paenibacillus sp. IHBB 10380]